MRCCIKLIALTPVTYCFCDEDRSEEEASIISDGRQWLWWLHSWGSRVLACKYTTNIRQLLMDEGNISFVARSPVSNSFFYTFMTYVVSLESISKLYMNIRVFFLFYCIHEQIDQNWYEMIWDKLGLEWTEFYYVTPVNAIQVIVNKLIRTYWFGTKWIRNKSTCNDIDVLLTAL